MLHFKQKINSDNVRLFFKGCLVGLSDMVPGISGSTIAFILNIYEKLIYSLKNINLKALLFLDFKRFLPKEDFKFLSVLFSGIFFSFIFFSKLLLICLEGELSRLAIYSFFLGALLAAGLFLFKEIKPDFKNFLMLAFGAALGFLLSKLQVNDLKEQSHFFLKLIIAGNLGICAMLLPGISGSFILLVMGVYPFAINALGNIFDLDNMKVIAFLGFGIFSGILIYPRIIAQCLKKYYFLTVSFLFGMIISSMYVLWPFRGYEKVVFSNKTILLPNKIFFPSFFSFNLYFSLLFVIFGFFLFYKIKLISEEKIKKISK